MAGKLGKGDGTMGMLRVYVVSDATGETAERVIRSALTQFEGAPVAIVRCGGVRTPEQVRAVVAEAALRDSLVLHTLVSDQLRTAILREARIHGVDAMDLLGPVLDRLATHLGVSPQEKPGLFSQLVEATSRRIEAVEFAFRHDDGQRVDELERAEIVLVGVSRTMKTPTTLYLAYHGWFAANVPIVPGIPPDTTLLGLPPEMVFGLTMSAPRLVELRQARAATSGSRLRPTPRSRRSATSSGARTRCAASGAGARLTRPASRWRRFPARSSCSATTSVLPAMKVVEPAGGAGACYHPSWWLMHRKGAARRGGQGAGARR